MRPRALIASVVIGLFAALLFIVWWNWRLYRYFIAGGMAPWTSALLVLLPFAGLLLWWGWSWFRQRRT
jgi:hypothetical protein